MISLKDEIKEIINRLERIDHKEYIAFEFADSATFDEMARCFEERKKMANYITNLQEKYEEADNDRHKLFEQKEYYKSRCEKSIECINYYAVENEDYSKIYNDEEKELLNILNGGDNNDK